MNRNLKIIAGLSKVGKLLTFVWASTLLLPQLRWKLSLGLFSGLFSKQERFSYVSLELMVSTTRLSFPTYKW